MSGRQLRVDREACIGSGNCVRVAESIFDQDDDGQVVILPGADPEGVSASIDLAVSGCPVGAIRWE